MVKHSRVFTTAPCATVGCGNRVAVPKDRRDHNPYCPRCREEVGALWPEARMDVVGQNGPDGAAYAADALATAADFLEAGLRHMRDRASTYDNPTGERSMGATVKAFAAITGIELTEEQGWLFMGVLKDVRSQQGKYRADNYEDRAAYAGLQGEAAARDRG